MEWNGVLAFEGLELEKVLKSGANGVVCLVRRQTDSRRFIYRQFSGTCQAYQKLQQLESEHLPKVFQLRQAGDQVQVLEEYIQGDTLSFLLEAGPLKEEQARQITLQLCSALATLHKAGVVHRDVKPANILIQGSQAVLIDFDAARCFKPEHSDDTQILGTTGYAAPEQYGFSQTDARADIYALGIVFNEMLTTQHPSKELAKGDFQQIIQRCTELNVDMRYGSADELYKAITRRARRHSRRRWAAAGAVAILAVALAWAALWPRSGRPQPAVQLPNGTQVFLEGWDGPQNVQTTSFAYDLDGDGTQEDYLFSIYHENVPIPNATWDYFALEEGGHQLRTVYPSVWKATGDGSFEAVTDFAPLLENPRVQLWKISPEPAEAPQVAPAEGIWPGGAQVVYRRENMGTWLYVLEAQLGDQSLQAAAISQADSYENFLAKQAQQANP